MDLAIRDKEVKGPKVKRCTHYDVTSQPELGWLKPNFILVLALLPNANKMTLGIFTNYVTTRGEGENSLYVKE